MNGKGPKPTAPEQDFPALLPGEKIDLEHIEIVTAQSDEEINTRYVTGTGSGRIVTETARYSLAGILAMLQETVPGDGGPDSPQELRYKLDPEYQRRHRWNNERKSRLIESFLMNVPVPPVFLYERELARYEVMDGRQRLTALSEFYGNKFQLEGLQYWPELNGRTYETLPSKVKDGIDRRYISSIILLTETATDPERAAQLKKMVFERLNSGGVRLSPQETRNAIYSGSLNGLCFNLSQNSNFRAMWGIPSEPPAEDVDDENEEVEELDGPTNTGKNMYGDMGDVELVLRFFAYRQIQGFPGGLNKISAFLDKFLVEGNKFPSQVIEAYKAMFEATIQLLFDLIGSKAFCRLNPDGTPHGRPTKIVYDPLMLIASRYANSPERPLLINNRANFLVILGKMYEEQGGFFGGRRTNSGDMQMRNRLMAEAFNAASNLPQI